MKRFEQLEKMKELQRAYVAYKRSQGIVGKVIEEPEANKERERAVQVLPNN